MTEVGISFDTQYDSVYGIYKYIKDPDQRNRAIHDLLKTILEIYTNSEAKNKKGRFLRTIGKFILKLLPFIKFNKNESNKN